MPVRIKDVASAGIGNAMRYSYDILAKKLKRRHILRSELEKQMSLLTGTLDYSGFHRVDMVVEAVFEDLALKHQMVKDVERECGEHTVFASNTSSLPINQIAAEAVHPSESWGCTTSARWTRCRWRRSSPTLAPVPRRSLPPRLLPAPGQNAHRGEGRSRFLRQPHPGALHE